MICRLGLDRSVSRFEDYLAAAAPDRSNEVQRLEKEKDGVYVVLLRHRPNHPHSARFLSAKRGGYIVSGETQDKTTSLTFVGSSAQIKVTLKSLEASGIHYQTVQLTDARFAADSPLGALTEKQRRVLTSAYRLGYYDLPRRISSEQLSKKLGIHKSALASHRRKAELRILAHLLKD